VGGRPPETHHGNSLTFTLPASGMSLQLWLRRLPEDHLKARSICAVFVPDPPRR
jgi:hypothetical protein